MASYFGEVVYPSSRAFWNDEEEDEIFDSSKENLEFIIKWFETEPSELKKLLVIEGEMIIDFVTTCILENAKCLCTIGYESDENCTKIYLVADTYVCVINAKLNLAQAGQLTELIAPLIKKSKNLYTLTCDHVTHFKSEEDIDSPSFLKSLQSSKAISNNNIPKISTLNQPNIVTGVCAGVLSYAEIANIPCIMYILYTDTFTLDSKCAFPLKELFSKLFEQSLTNFTTKDSSFFNKGNLYM